MCTTLRDWQCKQLLHPWPTLGKKPDSYSWQQKDSPAQHPSTKRISHCTSARQWSTPLSHTADNSYRSPHPVPWEQAFDHYDSADRHHRHIPTIQAPQRATIDHISWAWMIAELALDLSTDTTKSKRQDPFTPSDAPSSHESAFPTPESTLVPPSPHNTFHENHRHDA